MMTYTSRHHGQPGPEPRRTAPPAFMTAQEVANILRVHVETVRNRARQGKVPGATKVMGDWRFATPEILTVFAGTLWGAQL